MHVLLNARCTADTKHNKVALHVLLPMTMSLSASHLQIPLDSSCIAMLYVHYGRHIMHRPGVSFHYIQVVTSPTTSLNMAAPAD